MKKVVITICVILVLAGVGFGIWYGLKSADGQASASAEVYVQSVADITGYGSLGINNRYAGVVETQDTLTVNKDDTKTMKTIFVEVGDTVDVGTPLFEYDTEEMSLSIEQAQLELERLLSSIDNKNAQIESLEKEKKKASNDKQLEYTMQIQTLQAEIKQAEYDHKAKTLEMERTQESIDNAVINSTMAGVVNELNEVTSYDEMGNMKPFISILSQGEFRIKGTVDEINVWNLSVDQPVIIRSRTDETQTWSGIITNVDMENTINDNNSMYYYGGSSSETTTKYPFYIEMNEPSDLILGQHVFIELDNGQGEVKDGLYLPEYYLVMDGDTAYVWAATDSDKLEKRTVTLGEYDEEMLTYEITSGLAASDSIAWPDESCTEGASVIRIDKSTDLSGLGENDEGYNDGMGNYDDGMAGYDEGGKQ